MAPAIGGAVYNLGKGSPCTFRFFLATEGGWDIGCGLGLVVAAGMCALGGQIGPTILMGLPGIAAAGLMLWRYYRPTAALAAVT
jgi:DHA1 family inner membrane transport protein